MTPESFVSSGPGGTSFVGPDAVHLFRVTSLAHVMMIYKMGLKPTSRSPSARQVLESATRITGKHYRGEGKFDRAKADLLKYANELNAALPHQTEAAAREPKPAS